MPKNHEKQTAASLDVCSTPLLITKNESLKAYIQVFSHIPENIARRELGSIFGVFKIDDTHKDNAFIVNFLVTELKKEYYANPVRGAEAAFEASLNRVNIALSELAKQGNLNWMESLESAVCAFDKNNTLHFSVTGSSAVLLFRNEILSIISKGLAPKKNENPLKTFCEISSGKLQKNDKIVITSQELFDVFPEQELVRNAEHFSPQEFTRYVHTALVNSVPLAGSIVVDISKKKAFKPKQTSKTPAPSEKPGFNAFSGNTFREVQRSSPTEHIREEKQEEVQSDQTRAPNHIYIQQKILRSQDAPSSVKERLLLWKEHVANSIDSSFDVFLKNFRQWLRAFGNMLSIKIRNFLVRIKNSIPKKVRVEIRSTEKTEKKESALNTARQTLQPILRAFSQNPLRNLLSVRSFGSVSQMIRDIRAHLPKKIPSFQFEKTLQFLNNKKTTRNAIILTLFAIVIFSIFLFRDKSPLQENMATAPISEKSSEEAPATERENRLTQENNLAMLSQDQMKTVYASDSLVNVHAINESNVLIVEPNNVILTSFGQEQTLETFSPPSDLRGKTFAQSVYMKDLQLLFLVTDVGTLFSFSPVSKQFTENNLVLNPEMLDHILIDTYLTFLYVVNTQDNTILRYPRAEGGFGEPALWLASDSGVSLQGARDLSIDGSIYIALKDRILRLENRTENPLSFEMPLLSANFTLLETNIDTNTLHLFDTNEQRVLVYNKDDGSLVRQYALPHHTSPAEYLSLSALDENDLLLLNNGSIAKVSLQ